MTVLIGIAPEGVGFYTYDGTSKVRTCRARGRGRGR
jgi:hypothetical protein